MTSSSRRSYRLANLRTLRNTCLAALVIALLLAILPGDSGAAVEPGGAGTDTSLPDTSSAVDVQGRGDFAAMTFHVNQTESLRNQAISVTWTGGEPTFPDGGYMWDYVQTMQCWGDPDGTVPDNPGPPPEQCVSGATTGGYGTSAPAYPSGSETVSRILSFPGWTNYETTGGFKDPKNGFVWRPFRAVDGTVVNAHYDTDFNPEVGGGNYWLNPYFDINTTNEIAGGRTRADGTGAELFEVNTGSESTGLGCGQQIEPAGGGDLFTPQCWLVIVPRGDAAKENAGSPYESDAELRGVMTSPLSDNAWANRVAVPLEFNPVDSACALGSSERRVVGSELAAPAIASWQPALCERPGSPPYSYASITDDSARQQIVSPTVGSPGLALVSGPAKDDPTHPTVYAPLSLSGVVLGFNIERYPKLEASEEEKRLSGVRVENVNLTPRLVAKMLTQSYTQQVNVANQDAGYGWTARNPANPQFDPDFVQFNPEFAELSITFGRNFGGALAPGRNSDLAKVVWRWILADPEAKAWLDGSPDPWGMVVNPTYATTASANSNGVAFGDPAPQNFPKADPHCLEVPPLGADGSVVPAPLCGTDWLPYTNSLREGARMVRAGDDRAKVAANSNARTSDQYWGREGPQSLGRRSIWAVTDTPSAAQYGLQTARLSRAGDDGSDREFVEPDSGSLSAALGGMVDAGSGVLQPDPTATPDGAYPLAMVTYGMVRPLGLDDEARQEYASFVDYAVTDGQQPGLNPGDLPPGYAPLPPSLVTAARGAADSIRTMPPLPQAPPPELNPTQASSASNGSGGSSPTGRSSQARTSPQAEELAVDLTQPPPDSVEEPEQLGPLTPILALARSRFFIPVLLGLTLLSVLGALEITKRPRRGQPPVAPGADR